MAEVEAERLRAYGDTVARDSAQSRITAFAHEREHLIAEAAYRFYQQRQRDGARGSQLDDWLKAEVEIDRMLESRARVNDDRA